MLLCLRVHPVVHPFLQAQQPAGTSKSDATLMKANLGGSCSADFTVKDSDGKPVTQL